MITKSLMTDGIATELDRTIVEQVSSESGESGLASLAPPATKALPMSGRAGAESCALRFGRGEPVESIHVRSENSRVVLRVCVKCDGCGMSPIVGPRFKSVRCALLFQPKSSVWETHVSKWFLLRPYHGLRRPSLCMWVAVNWANYSKFRWSYPSTVFSQIKKWTLAWTLSHQRARETRVPLEARCTGWSKLWSQSMGPDSGCPGETKSTETT